MKTTPRRFGRSSRFVSTFIAVWWCLLLVMSPTQGRAAALPNVLVNNPAADATNRDTQLETSLVLGAGNTIFSAYVDSGSWDGVAGGANDHFIGLSTSLDGGATWMDLGTLPATIKGDGVNPVLARGQGVGSLADTIYLATTTFLKPEPGRQRQNLGDHGPHNVRGKRRARRLHFGGGGQSSDGRVARRGPFHQTELRSAGGGCGCGRRR